VWVTVREPAQVVVLDAGKGALLRTIALSPGAAPQGVIVVGDRAYVACSGTDTVQEIDATTGALTLRVAVADPRHLAWDPRRDRLIVPSFLSRGQADGAVSIIDRATLAPLTAIALGSSPGPDSGSDGRGTPNYLAAPVLTPDLGSAWIPGKKDNLLRGLRRDGQPLTFDHTVRSVGVRLDLDQQAEAFADREDFDNSDFTTAVAVSPLGDLLFFASLGSHTIWVMESEGAHSCFSIDSGGEGPIGLAMAPDGRTLYVHHLISRSVAAIDVSGVVGGNGLIGASRSGSTAAKEVLAPDVLAGKRLFHDTTDSALSQEGYMSCASCHYEGGHDGRTWDLSQLGEGLRNTLDLRGKAGMGQGPLHWSGNFDEVQDFEGQIRALNQGDGLLPTALLNAHGKAVAPADGEPKAGLSKALDQLAAYVASLDKVPTNPARPAAGLSPAAMRGRGHFIALDCMSCHAGAAFTDSAPGVRHDVGTLSAASGERLGRPLDGLDTPPLLGLDRSAPYLHDGSAATLEDVLTSRNPKGLHGATAKLSSSERNELVAFLRELSGEDAPTLAEVAPGQAAPKFTGPEPVFVLPIKAAAGLVLGTVSATDADRGQKLSYRLARVPQLA
jgi:cytochrome c peroxidase